MKTAQQKLKIKILEHLITWMYLKTTRNVLLLMIIKSLLNKMMIIQELIE